MRPEETYFSAWESHDWESLKRVCDEDVIYDIIGKQGFRGHGQVGDWWRKNGIRQKNIQIIKYCLDSGKNWSVYNFHAAFYDKLEGEEQVVLGEIYFRLNEENKIQEITEEYDVFAPPNSKKSFPEWVGRFFKRSLWWRFCSKVLSFFSTSAMLALLFLASVFLLNALSGDDNVVVKTVNKLVSYLSPAETGVAEGSLPVTNMGVTKKQISDALSPLMAVSTWFLFVFQYLLKFSGRRASVKVHKLSNDYNSANYVMSRYLDGADKASIFSGDFNFFEKDRRLHSCLKALDDKNSLKLYSERSKQNVLESVGKLHRTNELIKNLIRKGSIAFDVNSSNVRVSIIEKNGQTIVLNKASDQIIYANFGVDENQVIVKFIKSLLNVIDEKALSVLQQPKLVLVCGPAFSGSTTISRVFEKAGYIYKNLENLHGTQIQWENRIEKRSERIKVEEILYNDNDNDGVLVSSIERLVARLDKVVIDDCRDFEVIRLLKNRFSDRSLILYVDIPRTLQKERFSDVKLQEREDLNLRKIRDGEQRMCVDSVKSIADEIIVGVYEEPEIANEIISKTGISLN